MSLGVFFFTGTDVQRTDDPNDKDLRVYFVLLSMPSASLYMVRCITTLAICSYVALSCHTHNKAFQDASKVTSSRRWEISIPVTIPDSHYAVRISSDTTFTCFFTSANWREAASQIIGDSANAAKYIYFIDSISKANGIVNTSFLPAGSERCAPVSPAGATWTTIDTLFTRGQVSIRYANGVFVSKLECRFEHSQLADRTYYSDQVTGRTFHSVGVTRQGGF